MEQQTDKQALASLLYDIIIMGYLVMKEDNAYYILLPSEGNYAFWLFYNPKEVMGAYELHYNENNENYKEYMEYLSTPEECLDLLGRLMEQFN